MSKNHNETGPTAAELEAIGEEESLIDAELELLGVQLAMLDRAGPVSEIEVRRLRHARNAVIRESLALYIHQSATARRAA